MEKNTIETQLFDWEGWDELDTGDFQFYDCTLKVDIGPCKSGDKIKTIAILFSSSQIELYDDADILFSGRLILSVA